MRRRLESVHGLHSFRALGASRRRARSGAVTVRFVATEDAPTVRIAFVIGRRTGTAVVRNRLRRRARAVVADLDPRRRAAVVYGYFAALTVAPRVRDLGMSLGITSASSESALAAGLVMGIMIIPFISSMADDSIAAVPQAMRDGSLAMGATKSETIRRVVLPAALPGVVGGVLLAVSRAIGETMIVVMAAGLAANITANPFASVTTVTTQIVQLLTGDQEFDSAKTLAAFALGLALFLITLVLNLIALTVVRRYREAYE